MHTGQKLANYKFTNPVHFNGSYEGFDPVIKR